MPTSQNDRRIGLTWALASTVGTAIMVIPWKLANEAGDPANSVLLLLGVAAFGNTALVVAQRLWSGSLRFRIGATEIWVAALLAVFTLLGNLASAIAIQDLSPALLNLLLRADVLFVAIFGWLLLGEKVERRFWLGMLIAVVGLVVLQGPIGAGGFQGLLGSGMGMAVAAAACFSSLAIVTRRFIHQIDPVTVNAIRLWFAVAFWFPFHGIPDISAFPREQVFYSVLAAITGPFLGRISLMVSARYIEARLTTLATLGAPVLTLVLAFLVLSDWPQRHELIGGAIMIVGITIPLLRFAQPSTFRRRENKTS
jgi:drug/metabolite transporter (DMT)-like permease